MKRPRESLSILTKAAATRRESLEAAETAEAQRYSWREENQYLKKKPYVKAGRET